MMDCAPDCEAWASPALDISTQKEKEGPHSLVDPFLKEALQNPRHRLTILRMELDIQRFMQNPDKQQFEFQHFPTSYLRLAAHRVAQHYGLQSMALDNGVDGSGSRIMVRKTTESRYPAVCLSEVPAKQPENDKSEHVKIVIRSKPDKTSQGDVTELGTKRSPVRTVEERKEEYDRARARIFSGSSSPELEGTSQALLDGRSSFLGKEENEGCRNTTNEPNRASTKDCTSRVAIFRDREKDRSDPDYDRSYDRYIRSLTPNQSFSLAPFTMFPPPFVQYETGFTQLGQLPRTQTSMSHCPSNPMVNSLAVGSNQTSTNAFYHMHWPSPTVMYAQSSDRFRHAIFQAPFSQQPLSFDYSLNH